jgi:hypothetical protein
MRIVQMIPRTVPAVAGGFIVSFTVTTGTCALSDNACRVIRAPAAAMHEGIAVVAVTVLYLMVPSTIVMWVLLGMQKGNR